MKPAERERVDGRFSLIPGETEIQRVSEAFQ